MSHNEVLTATIYAEIILITQLKMIICDKKAY